MQPAGKDFEDTLMYAPPVPEKLTDQEVLSALDRVPTEFRAVILLADVEEFSYKEIAQVLQIPVGTVMSRLSRGRKLLRELLAGLARSYGIGGAPHEGTGA
jgi:RNA polymerase sigma-70 factor (ECF subfamily)